MDWTRLSLFVAIFVTTGCFADRGLGSGPILAERVDLSALSSVDDPAVGLAIDDQGYRYVLTRAGVLSRGSDAGFAPVWEAPSDLEVPAVFTDLAWIGGGRFVASTTDGDVRIDVDAGVMEPAYGYGDARSASSLTVAGDVVHAQVDTFFESYDVTTGVDISVAEAPYELREAHGMAYWQQVADVPESRRLIVGAGDTLYLVDVFNGGGQAYSERLGSLGIERPVQIEAMAIDPEGNVLSFIDANSNELRTLPLEETVESARQRQRDMQPLGS